MIPNTLTMVDVAGNVGTNLVLNKLSEQNGESVFIGEIDWTTFKQSVRMSVKHTIPENPTKGSSHLVKLTFTNMDLDGNATRTYSVHTVVKNSVFSSANNSYALRVMGDLLDFDAFELEFEKGAY